MRRPVIYLLLLPDAIYTLQRLPLLTEFKKYEMPSSKKLPRVARLCEAVDKVFIHAIPGPNLPKEKNVTNASVPCRSWTRSSSRR